jgi:hypothetical protein
MKLSSSHQGDYYSACQFAISGVIVKGKGVWIEINNGLISLPHLRLPIPLAGTEICRWCLNYPATSGVAKCTMPYQRGNWPGDQIP